MLMSQTFFWNKMARGYAKRPVADPDAYRVKLDKTTEYLNPTDHVLEFGCGTGTTALIHSSRVAHIDAIDLSSEMIAIAQEKRWDRSIRNVHFQACRFEDWPTPSPDQAYDAVLGMSILHLVDDLDATLAKVHSCLKPGGLFFSSTICLADSRGIDRFILPPLSTLGVLPKIARFKSTQLIDRMSSHGLEVEYSWRPSEGAAIFVVARRVD